MHVYVIRHADAVALGEGGIQRDEDRPLTALGLQQSRLVKDVFSRLGLQLDFLLTSPLTRARQTADAVLTPPTQLISCNALAPGGKKREVVEAIRSCGGESIGLVGHNPDLSELVGWFIGDKNIGVEMQKSGIACISFEAEATKSVGTLEWLVTPTWIATVMGPSTS